MSEVYQDRATGRTYEGPREMVNDYLRRFGESVRFAMPSLDDAGYAGIKRGSATIGVNVLLDQGLLLFLSRLCPVPEKSREALYRRILEENFLGTSDAAFAIDRNADTVCLRAMRRLSGLDYEEFEDLLGTIAALADRWDDELRAKFP
jgi:hypothetical protein